jgi:serine/threonine protein kinase
MNTAVIDDDEALEPSSRGGVRDEGSGVHVNMLEPGRQIGGKYVVHGKLGQGGFAVVYDAEHIGLGRRVAIKVVHLDEETPLAMLERARREARISALVRHPNVLEVFDSGTLEDGSPYLVMERIHGETLSARIMRQGFTVPAVVEIGRQLLTALEVLAQHDIVHRDIKSDNVMLHDPGDGRVLVKLVDFGISKRGGLDVAPRLTTDGTLVGTPSYMSPEQLRGEALDARTDIYSVGTVLYEALTGHVPHERTSLSELLLAALHDKVTPVREERPGCPRELERIVMKALEKDRDQRYPDAVAMRAELESFAASCEMPRDGEAFRAVEPIEPRAHRTSFTGTYQHRVRSALREIEKRVPKVRLVEFTLVACVLLIGGAARIYPMTLPEKVATVTHVPEEQKPQARMETIPPALRREPEEPHLLKLERPLLADEEGSSVDNASGPTVDSEEQSTAAS